jgi:hypothetical protein
MPARPTFSVRQLVTSGIVGVLGALGILGFVVTEDDFWPRVWIFLAVVAVVILAALAPYAYRWIEYIRGAVAIVPTLEDRLRDERGRTWLALETNALLGEMDITMQGLRLVDNNVQIHINVGSFQGVREGMQFEIVAPPDMDVYGVMRVVDAREEYAWCDLEETEGRDTFATRLRTRLAGADLTPPPGYEVRPFMTNAYRRTNEIVVTAVREESADFRAPETRSDAHEPGRDD